MCRHEDQRNVSAGEKRAITRVQDPEGKKPHQTHRLCLKSAVWDVAEKQGHIGETSARNNDKHVSRTRMATSAVVFSPSVLSCLQSGSSFTASPVTVVISLFFFLFIYFFHSAFLRGCFTEDAVDTRGSDFKALLRNLLSVSGNRLSYVAS